MPKRKEKIDPFWLRIGANTKEKARIICPLCKRNGKTREFRTVINLDIHKTKKHTDILMELG